MKTLLKGFLAGLLICHGASTVAQEDKLVLRMGEGTWPAWKGVAAGEASLNQGNMMYPGGGGLEGFLAAVITHGLLLHGSRSAMQREQQAKADAVLNPHKPVIDSITPQHLLEASRGLLTPKDRLATRTLELRPVFTMSHDERTLVLDNAIRIAPEGGAAQEKIVRVIAPAIKEPDASGHWQSDNGQALKKATATMLTHSIQLALAMPATTEAPAKPHRTLRYKSGDTENMERAILLGRGCNRIVMETLKGWLLSAPRSDSKEEECLLRPYDYEMEDQAAASPSTTPNQ
jgi:hypothetical protein